MNYLIICDSIIKPKLNDMLGKKLADNLLTQARFATTTAKSDREKLQIFVDTICKDDHFIGMWGTAQAARQKDEWLGLYR